MESNGSGQVQMRYILNTAINLQTAKMLGHPSPLTAKFPAPWRQITNTERLP